MLTAAWLAGLLRRRPGRIVATTVGVAVAVSLMASIGVFLSGSTAAMTERAVAQVPLDWQVQAQPGANADTLLHTISRYPGVRSALPVAYAETAGYTASAHGVVNTAGAGLVLGVPASYRATYPGEFRQYIGARRGVLIAQQMAANLGITTGGTVSIQRAGLPRVKARVQGVIDFPAAQQLLVPVGTSTGTTPPLPPDNVLVVPMRMWRTLFAPLAKARPDLVRYQVHAELDHRTLPHDPTAAFNSIGDRARNLEARLQGAGVVGNNLGQALDKARGDSLYARIAFLFLGLPGALLAALVTVTIASAGGERRRREQALLRARGATVPSLLRLALAEATLVGAAGSVLGLAAAALIGRLAFDSASFGAGNGRGFVWALAALAAGLLLAAAAIVLPAWRDARALTVSAARAVVGRARAPWWFRYRLDFLAIAAAIAVYIATGRNGYKLVLAVEGTQQVSVNYWSFLAPLLAWVGIGLLSWRLATLALGRGRPLLARAARPLAGELAGTVAAGMSRQRSLIARAFALVTLATCFAASTAAFNATYKQQAEIDARLSNGADVVVTTYPGAHLTAGSGARLARLGGVASVEPLLHRYAYIGQDLQDLYGVNAATVVRNAQLSDPYFSGGSASGLIGTLGRTPNGILVSAEVVHDYQLNPGDTIRLRVLDQHTRAPITVPFRYLGITNEFPTAPKDAYTIVNAGYVAQATHDPTVGSFLIQTDGASPQTVGNRVRAAIGISGMVTDITTNRKLIAGSLTSVELTGLIRVELAYALVLVAAAAGLLLWLGFAERRRTFAIASALGAKRRQLGAFVWTETVFITVGGVLAGVVGATWLTIMLVKLLTGVFDPPPTAPTVPWPYLGLLAAVTLAAVAAAAGAGLRALRRPALETLRDL
ncbi:MAG TPA: FtsX-like permease family protein [Gaiellaceae bacterium]|nr:FtsX-like permease family protein [Gaiellaceae bacterium]